MPSQKKSTATQTPIQASQHQLRNKISIIRGTVEILRITENLSPEGVDDVERMRRACDDMLNLVDHLTPLENH